MASDLPISPLACSLPTLDPVKGVRLGATSANIRYKDRLDLMMMSFDEGTSVAGVFTKSRCPGAPVDWCKACLPTGKARALVVNSGNANVFTGQAGHDATRMTAACTSQLHHCPPEEIYIASTGVIGEILPVEKVTNALPNLYGTLKADSWADAARAIMTTDTFPKAVTKRAFIGETEVTIQGIAKGSGMVAPDLATMLAFVVTDANLGAGAMQTLLHDAVQTSFNCITVDSDTSTSDTVLVFSTGASGHTQITRPDDPQLSSFKTVLSDIMRELAIMVVRDGEGIRKLMQIDVSGADNGASARRVGLAIANSPLVKTAIAGEDANWGRIVMAVGKSGEPANRDTLSISIGGVTIAQHGTLDPTYHEDMIKTHMQGDIISIQVDLGLKEGKARVWGCDLTHAYIKINGDYRS